MAHDLCRAFLVQPCQPRPRHKATDILPPYHKHNNHEIVENEDAGEYARNYHSIPTLLHPGQYRIAKAKTDRLFADVDGSQHLRSIGKVGVYCVCNSEREVEVLCPGEQAAAEEVHDPMEVLVRREAIQD